jgi:hypothetical protein
MNENDVVQILRDFISKEFPQECQCCGQRFGSLAEYLRITTHVGKPISYDAEEGNWRPERPIGTSSFANCLCGTTLAITSRGMNLNTLWRLMGWARKETKERGIKVSDLLLDLRRKIDESVLQNEGMTFEN